MSCLVLSWIVERCLRTNDDARLFAAQLIGTNPALCCSDEVVRGASERATIAEHHLDARQLSLLEIGAR